MERYDRGEQENLYLGSKNFWNTLKAQKPQKLKIFKKRPKRCILLQNQKVCWLLTYHDSFISTLQIYAQKKRI